VESLSFNLRYRLRLNIINYSYKCAGQFQVAAVDLNHDHNDDLSRDQQVDVEINDEHGGKGGGRQDARHDVIDEELSSPASYVACFIWRVVNDYGQNSQTQQSNRDKASGSEMRRPGDIDGTQFFRRIHLICVDNTLHTVVGKHRYILV
jgi:hypothetical protein